MKPRQFKFRAWDGKKMHDDVTPWQWDFVISRSWHRCEKSTGAGLLGSGGDTGEFLVPGIRFETVMQFTGLKDKNGVEIYEGDIVIFLDRDWGDFERDTKRLPVVYKNDRFILLSTTEDRYGEFSEYDLHKDYGRDRFEVIGNIYQNPELIKTLQ